MSTLKNLCINLGDSTTAGSNCGNPYSQQLELLLGPSWSCINLGHTGDTSSAMVSVYQDFVQGQFAPPSASYYRILTMMIGVNDLDGAGSNSAAQTAANGVMTNLATVYNNAIGSGHFNMVIVMAPTPANGYFQGVPPTTGSSAEYGYELTSNSSCLVNQIMGLSVSGLTTVNINSILSSTNTSSYPHVYSTGTTYSQASTKADYATQADSSLTDYLHPNAYGHGMIAQTLFNTITGAGY